MKRKGPLNALLLIAAGLFALRGIAQGQAGARDQRQTPDSFTYKASLDTISQAGFYRVILTPEVLAKCNEKLSDIRIEAVAGGMSHGSENADVNYVPYVLKTDFPTEQGENFIEFPILPAQKEDSVGDIRIGNWSGGAVDSLFLQVSPSASTRSWTLSGSNDGQKWFAIKEQIPVSFPASNLPYNEMALNFPKSNYHYFKISQENKGVLPLNIVRAGIITRQAGVQRFRSIPSPVVSQKDSSDHHSYISLSFREPYVVEYLKLYIKSPRLFSRVGMLFDKEQHSAPESLNFVPNGLSFDVGPMKSRSLLFDISNDDNAPLVLDKIEAFQKERYLLTWLEPGRYDLLVGDKHAQAPNYDLKYFVDTVRQEPVALMPGHITANPFPTFTRINPSRDYKGVYLWAAIIIVLVLLIWLCFNMLKSIRESRG